VGLPGTGKSHLAQALGQAAIQQGHRVLYREAHVLLEELTDATLDGTRKAAIAALSTVPLLIIDDLGMRKLPATAAEDLLEVIMRRYERASTILTSNRFVSGMEHPVANVVTAFVWCVPSPPPGVPIMRRVLSVLTCVVAVSVPSLALA